jgi:thiol-disulfide isomerase/thioredoxin
MHKSLISLAILSLASISIMPIANSAPKGSMEQPKGAMESPKGSMSTPNKPLAKELQGKPVLVDVYASWCGGCQAIKPTLSSLKKQYAGKVSFVVFDVSNKATTKAAEMKAQRLGLASFLADNKSKTATVAIIDPATGKILKLYQVNPEIKDYSAVLDPAIAAR